MLFHSSLPLAIFQFHLENSLLILCVYVCAWFWSLDEWHNQWNYCFIAHYRVDITSRISKKARCSLSPWFWCYADVHLAAWFLSLALPLVLRFVTLVPQGRPIWLRPLFCVNGHSFHVLHYTLFEASRNKNEICALNCDLRSWCSRTNKKKSIHKRMKNGTKKQENVFPHSEIVQALEITQNIGHTLSVGWVC